MQQTLTAMFDSRADAEQARTRLAAAGISQDDVTIHDQDTTGVAASGSSSSSSDSGTGIWASIKSLFSDDSHVYEEGLRRGGYLLTARVDESLVDRAYDILDDEGTVDLGERSSNWQREGWSGTGLRAHDDANWRDADRDGTGAAQDYRHAGTVGDRIENGVERATGTGSHGVDYDGDGDRDLGDRMKQGLDKLTGGDRDRSVAGTAGLGAAGLGAAGMAATGRENEVIPVVEERLDVTKRDVRRGGVRVRSYVVETPVHEEVRLREEHVDVERRPVTGARAVQPGDVDNLFRERSIEAVETGEEAVVRKDAVVREEVAINRSVEERVQNIDETVRRTEVDVERLGTDTDRNDPTRR